MIDNQEVYRTVKFRIDQYGDPIDTERIVNAMLGECLDRYFCESSSPIEPFTIRVDVSERDYTTMKKMLIGSKKPIYRT